MSKVLVTGAAGGFGRLISQSLLEAGHDVVGSMREIHGREVAADLRALGGRAVEIDVTNDAVEPGGFSTEFWRRLMSPSDPARADSYDIVRGLGPAVRDIYGDERPGLTGQDPQLVADAVVGLIAAPMGRRSARTVVDRTGIGEQVIPYNVHHERMTRDVFALAGFAHLLDVRLLSRIDKEKM